MKNKFLEAGQIVNTHGVQGELKIVPWPTRRSFSGGFDVFYIDGAPVKVLGARAHKGNILVRLEGVGDVNAAMRLKGKIISIDRTGVVLPEGRHFIADLIGLEVRDGRQRRGAGSDRRCAHPAGPRGLCSEGRAPRVYDPCRG